MTLTVSLLSFWGDERTIAESAWTSTGRGEGRSDDEVAALVRSLWSQGHGSPFEHVLYRFHITCPRYIETQLLRYRIQSANCMSGRYRTMPTEFLSMPEDIEEIETAAGISSIYKGVCGVANAAYALAMQDAKKARDEGLIDNAAYKRYREFIRGILPQANLTEIVTVFNLRSLVNVWQQRLSSHAQPEIQEIARQMFRCVEECRNLPNILPIIRKELPTF